MKSKQCEECKNFFSVGKHLVHYEGKKLCRRCRSKKKGYTLMRTASQIGRPLISIEKALDKIYTIRGGNLSFPMVLVGKYFKIIVLDKKINLKEIDLINAINKIYKVKEVKYRALGRCNFPKILINKKIKIKLYNLN